MTSNPRAALRDLVAALERHLEMAADSPDKDDPKLIAAYQRIANAFVDYDDALLEVYGEVTPLDVYREDDDEDDDEDDGDDDRNDDDYDEDDLDAEDHDGVDVENLDSDNEDDDSEDNDGEDDDSSDDGSLRRAKS